MFFGKKNRRSFIRNNAGSILMQVMASTAAMSISFYYVTNYVLANKKQVSKTLNVVDLKLTLDSTMDYVIYGIHKKYCFTDNGILANDTPTACTLAHSGSVERLIMSADQESFIKQAHSPTDPKAKAIDFGAGVDYNNLPLKEIHRYVYFNSLSNSHPLRIIANHLKLLKDVSDVNGKQSNPVGVKVDLYRDTSKYLPISGKEAFITVKLALIDSSNNVLYLGNKPLTMASSVSIYPREVGSFALMVPNDLRLDQNYSSVPSTGDVSINMYQKRSMFSGVGLRFLSPVFVNKDIVVPKINPSVTDINALPYSPVTFADRVIMGNGVVRSSDGVAFSPRTLGGIADRTWSDMPGLGGFLKGIDNDSGFDKGLQVFAGVSGGSSPNVSLMHDCVKMTNGLANINEIKAANLAAKQDSDNNYGSSVNSKFKVYFDKVDQFSEQPIKSGMVKTGWPAPSTVTFNPKEKTNVVFEVTFWIGTKYVSFSMPYGESASMVGEVGSPAFKNSLASAIGFSQSSYNYYKAVSDANKAVTDMQTLINSDESLVRTAETNLKNAQSAASPAYANLPSYKATLESAQSSLSSAQSSLNSAYATLNATPAYSGQTCTSDQTVIRGKAPNTVTTTIKGTCSPTPNPAYASAASAVSSAQSVVNAASNAVNAAQANVTNAQNLIYDAEVTKPNALKAAKTVVDQDYNRKQAAIEMVEYVSRELVPPKLDFNFAKDKSNRAILTVNISNVQSFVDVNGVFAPPVFKIKAYDLKYHVGVLLDSSLEGDALALEKYLNYTSDPSVQKLSLLKGPYGLVPSASTFDATRYKFKTPDALSSTKGGSSQSLAQLLPDMDDLESRCKEARNTATSESFSGVTWTQDFSPATRHSWNFAGLESALPGDDPAYNADYIFNSGNSPAAYSAPDYPQYNVKSIVRKCTIQSSATVVNGFFACDYLEIQARSTPLVIIGSFIVKKMTIDPQALQSGITWMTIYHPQATAILRKVGLLHPVQPLTSCDLGVGADPIWHPKTSMQQLANQRSCNAISLRAKAAPFQWTTVDPDCGLLPGSSNTSCKNRLVNFYVIEQSREEGRTP